MDVFKYLRESETQSIHFYRFIVELVARFREIQTIDDFKTNYAPYVIDVTDTPEIRLFNEMATSEEWEEWRNEVETYTFLFHQGTTYKGMLDLSFYNSKLANIRMHVVVFGPSTWGLVALRFKAIQRGFNTVLKKVQVSEIISEISDDLLSILSSKDRKNMALMWKDEDRELYIVLRKWKDNKSNISIWITDEKYL